MLMIEDKLLSAVKDMYIPAEFGIDYDDVGIYSTFEDFADSMYDILGDCDVMNGLSKAVIAIPDVNYVIKIPFNGAWYLNEDDEDEPEEVFCEYDINDYCELEEATYKIAENEGYGKFFAKTWFSGMCVNNTKIYLQEKVVPFSVSTSKPSKEAVTSAHEIRRKVECYVDYRWIASLVEWYGADVTTDFLGFIHDNNIDSDLHYGNLAYRFNGEPVLMDYSGFEH